VAICNSDQKFLETYISVDDVYGEVKERPFSFHSDEAREEVIFYDLVDCFSKICKTHNQCPE
jgi:hypothetical protein